MNKINFKYPVYPDLTTQNGGHLPNVRAAHACWFYHMLAHQMWEQTDQGTESQIILEEDRWMNPHYEQLARTTAMVYQLDSPDDFLKFRDYVDRQSDQLNLPRTKDRYMRPLRLRLTQ